MSETLVVFCKNPAAATQAAAELRGHEGMDRLFVLYCEKPKPQEMKWLGKNDNYLALDRVQEWNKDIDIGIRAGILYSSGWWNLLFCSAANIPTPEEINIIRGELLHGAGFAKNESVWGVTREHILLYGLGSAMSSEDREEPDTTSHTAAEMEVASAIKGQSVSAEALCLALRDITPMQNTHIQGDLESWETDSRNIVMLTTKNAKINRSESPTLIFASDETSEEGLIHLLSRLSGYGAVVIIGKKDYKVSLEPYRTLKSTNGVNALLFSNKK